MQLFPKEPQTREVVIIGSGPAGFTAAIYAARARLDPLVLGGVYWGGQLVLTSEVENFPGYVEGIMGPEMMAQLREQAERFGAEVRDVDVTRVDFSRRPFVIETDDETILANSVIGMLRDTNQSLGRVDATLAERVLSFDDTVDRFKTEISLDAQQKVAGGLFGVKFAFRLMTVVKSLERIADHCTNICEQLIYLETGRIVRHMPEGWSKPVMPEV